jgi:hypothetical protein
MVIKMNKNKLPMQVNGKNFDSAEDYAKQGRGCATIRPNHYQIQRNDERIRSARIDLNRIRKIEIDVQFIHITDGNIGHVSEQQRINQISVLNRSYQDADIEFIYKPSNVKFHNEKKWFHMDHGSVEERQAKSSLRASPERHLNFYTAGLSAGLLGWATFPWELDGDRDRDGVVILHSTFPGGNEERFNLGMTAVHEIGHWLGLYHTFQGGCNAFGDHVADTVSHSEPNTGTPQDGQRNGACELNSLAPIHNYMNYTDDEWLSEFTLGQINRIKSHIAEYRSSFIKN